MTVLLREGQVEHHLLEVHFLSPSARSFSVFEMVNPGETLEALAEHRPGAAA